MIGRWGAYGGDAAVAPQGAKGPVPVADLVATLLPAVQLVTEELSDPYRKVEVLTAKLENARMKGASAGKLNLLEARLVAAQRAVGLRTESEQSTRDWRALGKAGIATGIGLGVALILLITLRAVRR